MPVVVYDIKVGQMNNIIILKMGRCILISFTVIHLSAIPDAFLYSVFKGQEFRPGRMV